MVDDTRRVVVGAVDEIPPGERKLIVPFRGRAGIGVFNVNGTFHALRNLCPHKSGPLCTGRVGPLIVADAPPTAANANLDIVRDGEIIRCPWHMWEFEIATGRCLVDPRARVKTYPVVVEAGQVVVYANPADLPPHDPADFERSAPPHARGPGGARHHGVSDELDTAVKLCRKAPD